MGPVVGDGHANTIFTAAYVYDTAWIDCRLENCYGNYSYSNEINSLQIFQICKICVISQIIC